MSSKHRNDESAVRILVVEDSSPIRKLICEHLEREGYTVYEAKDGVEGLEKAIQYTPEVIISDIIMPRMDGLEFCRKIRSNQSTHDAFFIIATAMGDRESRLEGLRAGCNEYLNKPVSIEEMVLRVSAAVKMKSMQKAIQHQNMEMSRVLSQLEEHKAIIDEEIAVARHIQRNLLPTQIPSLSDYHIEYLVEPCMSIGGDMVDVVRLSRNEIVLALADVSGHEMPATLVAGMVHAWIRSQLQKRLDIEEIFTRLNKYIYQYTLPEMYVTLFFGILHLDSGLLRCAIAGHPPPVQYRNGKLSYLELESSPAIGLHPRILPHVTEIQLPPDSGLLVYSDGLPESIALFSEDDQFTTEYLFQTFFQEHRKKSLKWIYDSLISHVRDHKLRDDVAMLLIYRES